MMSLMLRWCSFLTLATFANGFLTINHHAGTRMLRNNGYRGNAYGFARSLAFKHRLRICNAYPYNGAIDVYRGREKLTGEEALPYKSCKDFLSPLKAGDRLNFKVVDANAGVFTISDLPNNDAVLMLVIHRHDTLSTAVSFESHVFANLLNAQVAVIDTYKGVKRSRLRILDAAQSLEPVLEKGEQEAEEEIGEKPKKTQRAARSEELRYDSVVAVNAGIYQVEMEDQDDEAESIRKPLVALNRESYVVIRTGVDAQQGPKYPQDLLVYPQSDPSIFYPPQSGAPVAAIPSLVLLILTFLAGFMW